MGKIKVESYGDALNRYAGLRKNRFLKPQLWTYKPRLPFVPGHPPKQYAGVQPIGGWSQKHLRRRWPERTIYEKMMVHWRGSPYAVVIMGTYILYDQV